MCWGIRKGVCENRSLLWAGPRNMVRAEPSGSKILYYSAEQSQVLVMLGPALWLQRGSGLGQRGSQKGLPGPLPPPCRQEDRARGSGPVISMGVRWATRGPRME